MNNIEQSTSFKPFHVFCKVHQLLDVITAVSTADDTKASTEKNYIHNMKKVAHIL